MFSLHTHTDNSNSSRGFKDSSMKTEQLVKKAMELGLEGVAITDHEITSSFVLAKKLEKKHNFPVICGNEIYLVSPTQDKLLREGYDSSKMYYPHFLVLALDEIGNRMLRELSSIAWESSYYASGIVRTTTLMTDVERVVNEFGRGHLVASSACLGGFVAKTLLDIHNNSHNEVYCKSRYNNLNNYVNWCMNIFGVENFYLECQPASEEQVEQIVVNDMILKYSKENNIPYIITTDAHYISKEFLEIHKNFLNADDEGSSDREVDKFYRTAYLMSEDEVREYFKPYWNEQDIDVAFHNTRVIGNRAKRYTLSKKQVVPKIKFSDDWKVNHMFFPYSKEYIQKFLNSEYEQDRYLMYLIEHGMKEKIEPQDYTSTFERIEEELEEFWHVSVNIEDRLSAYFVTMNKLIDIFWTEADSYVGVGRGSGVSSIINYILDITQINPLKMGVDMPFWRFVNRERSELPKIVWALRVNLQMQGVLVA